MDKELQYAIDAAKAAGEIIRSYYQKSYEIREKEADSPVTPADLHANQRIREILQEAFPPYGWLSEETVDSAERLSRHRVWVVDPLDGTKEFIQRVPEFCVCVSLVEKKIPVLGVSYNPIRDECFWAMRGAGAYLNGQRIQVSATKDLRSATLLASRSEIARGEWQDYQSLCRIEPTGSVAYKLALVAAGKGDATFSLSPKNEWDVCAGTMMVSEAGGRITDGKGNPLAFNRRKTLINGIVVSNGWLHGAILALIRKRAKPYAVLR